MSSHFLQELQRRSERTKILLEKVFQGLGKKGVATERFDEIHTTFQEFSQKFLLLNNQLVEASAASEALRARVEDAETRLAIVSRENDKLKEQLYEKSMVVTTTSSTSTSSSGNANNQNSHHHHHHHHHHGEASEPDTKKHKVAEGASDVNSNGTTTTTSTLDPGSDMSVKLTSLERLVQSLKEDNARLSHERDNTLLNFKSLSDEAIRSSALYISQQATLAWHQKEQTTHASSLQQLQDTLNNALELQKIEREKMTQWKMDFERASKESISLLKKELASVRQERDDLRAKFDVESAGSSREKIMTEVKTLLDASAARFASLESKLATVTAERDALLSQQQGKETTTSAVSVVSSGGGGGGEELSKAQVEIETLRNLLKVEKAKYDANAQSFSQADEKLREFNVVLNVWKKANADKRELLEVKESEALLKLKVSDLEKKVEAFEKAGQSVMSEEKMRQWESVFVEQIKKLSEALVAEKNGSASTKERVVKLEQELQGKVAEGEALMGEMQNIVGALEELQKQNERLMEELGKKDDTQSLLIQQKAASRQMETLLREEKNQLVMKMSSLKKLTTAQKTQITQQKESNDALAHAVQKLEEENQLLTTTLDKERTAVKDLQRTLTDIKIKSDDSVLQIKELTRKMETVMEEKRVIVQEDLKVRGEKDALQQAVDSYRRLGSDNVIEEQLRQLQTAARCSVCNDQYKNTVLTTCFHTFCRDCVNAVIQTRSRKCPRCGKSFDKIDVKQIFLDFDGAE